MIAGQYIVVTDLGGFSKLITASQVAKVEQVLDRLLEVVGQVCQEFGGKSREKIGDAYCLTFTDADRAMTATERMAELRRVDVGPGNRDHLADIEVFRLGEG